MPKKTTKRSRKNIYKFSEDLELSGLRKKPNSGVYEKIQGDLTENNSYLNLILGTLIVIVLGVLIFNYFNKPGGNLGPAGQTELDQKSEEDSGKTQSSYTIKAGDTLFMIALKFYNDGYKYPKIVQANNIANENLIEVGQILQIPTLDEKVNQNQATQPDSGGTQNQTLWGEAIKGSTYTVMSGDWLSKIAGRAYGDILMFNKIAQANNLTNPNNIEPGIILKIPR